MSGAPQHTAPLPLQGIAYLIAPRYPSISHTFILREVRALRAEGVPIETFSIYPPDRPPDQLTAEEQEEAARTQVLSQHAFPSLLTDHAKTFLEAPLAYVRCLGYALRLAGGNAQQSVYWLKAFMAAPLLGQALRRQRLHHLHVHFSGAAASVGLLCQRLFPITFSMMVHGPEEFYDVKRLRLAEKYAACRFILAISHYARSQIMRLLPPDQWGKIHVTRLGVDPQRFPPAPFRDNPKPLRLLCVGRLTAVKGQHLLLFALRRLLDEGHDLHLTLIGEGEERPRLEALREQLQLTPHLQLAGAVNQDHLLEYLHQADIFVQPSFAEGIPVALMEAMAAQLPCITSRITGHPELITHQHDGLLTPAGDLDALCAALRRLAEQPELRKALSLQARQRVQTAYTLATNMRTLAQRLQNSLR